jgi:archaellum component FlaC
MAKKGWDQLSDGEKFEAIRGDLRKIMDILGGQSDRIGDLEKAIKRIEKKVDSLKDS